MQPEDVAQIRKDLPTPWNDLREQRVLARIQEVRRHGQARPVRPILVGGGVAAAAVCGAVAITMTWRHPTAAAPALAVAPAVAVASATDVHEQLMALADGSQAILVRNARVQVEEQRPDLVHVAQESGEVRYEVRPDPSREFVVFAPGATVRVRGTIFTVEVESDQVKVSVQRGKVEVNDGARTRDLVVGETLGIPARPRPAADEDSDGNEASGGTAEPAAVPKTGVPSFSDLLARADRARAAGRQDDAAGFLDVLLATHPHDARAPSALFALGKVERARQRPETSARAFERCWQGAPKGPLAQDALAEAATSWASGGQTQAAKADAKRYLERWPDGLAAARMRAILER